MTTKTTTLLALAVLAMACIVPMCSEESDAADTKTVRLSTYTVFQATFENITEDAIKKSTKNSDYLYMVEGSDNYNKMQSYLSDPTSVNITGDDYGSLKAGDTLHIYALAKGVSSLSISFGSEMAGTVAKDPYNTLSLDVKKNDVITIKTKSLKQSDGSELNDATLSVKNSKQSCTLYKNVTSRISVDGEKAEFEFQYTSETALYADIEMEISIKSPSGSATMFAGICFVISVIAIAILVASAVKPGWSKK